MPSELSLTETHVSTPTAIPAIDVNSAAATTATTIGTDLTNFVGSVWPYLLGLILLILFMVIAVRIATGAVRKLGGLGRRA